jgi:hypothetical protein
VRTILTRATKEWGLLLGVYGRLRNTRLRWITLYRNDIFLFGDHGVTNAYFRVAESQSGNGNNTSALHVFVPSSCPC